MKNNIIYDLYKRKLIKQISNKNLLYNINNKNIKIYCGFDPTYKSLHIGHLLLLITLKRFIKYKYKITIILGEITAYIGDPSFKKKNRKQIEKKKINDFKKKIKKQINYILNNNNKKKINIISNKKWFKKIKLINFLNKIAKHFKIKYLLNKNSIKQRNKKYGINFKEITYNLLQSYDFYLLFKKYNINLQIGGSDQWGNITSGIYLIKKIFNKQSYGLTIPLITNKKGKKFGKSKTNNIWLDKNKTTPFEFYQFWLNIKDDKLYIYFKQLTFLSIKQIKKIFKKNNINKNKKILAKYITKIVHGKKETKKAIFVSKYYFIKFNYLTLKILNKLYKLNIPKIKLKNKYKEIKKILIKLKISNSKSHAHNLIINKSININKQLINDTNFKITKKNKLFNKYTIISKGKKNFYLIYWI